MTMLTPAQSEVLRLMAGAAIKIAGRLVRPSDIRADARMAEALYHVLVH